MELVRHLNCRQDRLKVIKEIKLGWKSIRNTWKDEQVAISETEKWKPRSW